MGTVTVGDVPVWDMPELHVAPADAEAIGVELARLVQQACQLYQMIGADTMEAHMAAFGKEMEGNGWD